MLRAHRPRRKVRDEDDNFLPLYTFQVSSDSTVRLIGSSAVVDEPGWAAI
jgi:hypothetical protein